MDQSLLCDEVWPSSPLATAKNYMIDCETLSMYARSKRDYDESFTICLEKEMSYMPQPNYVENLCSNNLVIARFKSIQWFVKSGSRLNLSLGTVFYAANYLDRFISMNNAWKYWMVELLSIACLSIASKFNDTCSPTLLEIQMEDLDYSFDSSTIQRMEMMVLEALGWRLASTTAYSYLELMLSLAELVKCQKIMEAQSVADDCLYNLLAYGAFHFCPSSPTTVLLKEKINLSQYHVDFSVFNLRAPNVDAAESTRICQKRKREE
ncbi:PREDICTED: putative cyclin-D7-1-like [Fragaria vesca subsp. vesca]